MKKGSYVENDYIRWQILYSFKALEKSIKFCYSKSWYFSRHCSIDNTLFIKLSLFRYYAMRKNEFEEIEEYKKLWLSLTDVLNLRFTWNFMMFYCYDYFGVKKMITIYFDHSIIILATFTYVCTTYKWKIDISFNFVHFIYSSYIFVLISIMNFVAPSVSV